MSLSTKKIPENESRAAVVILELRASMVGGSHPAEFTLGVLLAENSDLRLALANKLADEGWTLEDVLIG